MLWRIPPVFLCIVMLVMPTKWINGTDRGLLLNSRRISRIKRPQSTGAGQSRCPSTTADGQPHDGDIAAVLFQSFGVFGNVEVGQIECGEVRNQSLQDFHLTSCDPCRFLR